MKNDLLHKYYQLLETTSWQQYIPKYPEGLYQAVSYIMSLGGKRLRPIAVLLGCDLFNGNLEKAVRIAWSLELFHNFTLAHDDIMDYADTRRGHPSLHKKYSVEQAIISGDALMILAYQGFESLSDATYKKVNTVFSKAALDICEGQQLDMDFETKRSVNLDQYLVMIKGKTSALLGAALQIGSLVANAPDDDAQKLYQIGAQVGMAFQIKDDWLDAFGDQQKVGKLKGGDFLQRKKSIPWIIANQDANDQQRMILDQWLARSNEVELDSVYSVLDQLRISEKTNQLASEKLQSSLKRIDTLNISTAQKERLINWCNLLVNRSF